MSGAQPPDCSQRYADGTHAAVLPAVEGALTGGAAQVPSGPPTGGSPHATPPACLRSRQLRRHPHRFSRMIGPAGLLAEPVGHRLACIAELVAALMQEAIELVLAGHGLSVRFRV